MRSSQPVGALTDAAAPLEPPSAAAATTSFLLSSTALAQLSLSSEQPSFSSSPLSLPGESSFVSAEEPVHSDPDSLAPLLVNSSSSKPSPPLPSAASADIAGVHEEQQPEKSKEQQQQDHSHSPAVVSAASSSPDSCCRAPAEAVAQPLPSLPQSSAALTRSSGLTPISSVSLLPRKRAASSLSPVAASPVSAPPVLPAPGSPRWVSFSLSAAQYEAAGDVDSAADCYLQGILSAPQHPYCRSAFARLLLRTLALHPLEMQDDRDRDIDREVDVIAELDDEQKDEQDEHDGSQSTSPSDSPSRSSEQSVSMEDDDPSFTSMRQTVHDRSSRDPQQQRQQQREAAATAHHADAMVDKAAACPPAAVSGDESGASSTQQQQQQQCDSACHKPRTSSSSTVQPSASLSPHPYPRSLASIRPAQSSLSCIASSSLASASAESSSGDVGDEDEEMEMGADKDEYALRLASVSYLSPDLSCSLCGLFMYRPVTGMCGHSFCQLCLSTFIDRHPPSAQSSLCCPNSRCSEPLLPLTSRSVCVQLTAALEKCFPHESAVAKLHSEAIAAVTAGKDEQAVQHLTSVLLQWPESFPLYSTRLCCFIRLCQFDAATDDLKHCIRLTQPLVPPAAVERSSSSPQQLLSRQLQPKHSLADVQQQHPHSSVSDSRSSQSPQPSPPDSTHTLQRLTALGHAGLITGFYRVAVYAFASALRLSAPDERSIDREKVADSLIDAFIANVNAALSDAFTAQQQQQATKPAAASAAFSSFSSFSASAPFSSSSPSLAKTSTSSVASSASSMFSASQSSTRFQLSSSSSSHSSSRAHSSSQSSSSSSSLSPSLSAFYHSGPVAPSSVSPPRPAPRRQQPYRLMCDHPTPALIASELHCLVCMELLYEPTTTVCGHTFCRLCLARSLDHNNLCPFCRVGLAVHISPTRQAVNVSIKALLQRWCERRYERRHASVVAELREQSDYLPVFVCTLMFPGVSCPLHVFEPRYRLMLRNVLESGYNRFGMCVQVDRDGHYATVGCTAEIRNVRLLPDGRSLVDCVGGRRFSTRERSQRNGYDVAKVDWLDDLPEEEQRRLYSAASPSLSQLQQSVHDLVHDMLLPRLLNAFDIESQLGAMPSMDAQPALFCFWLCAVLPMRMDDKYEFLQLTSHYERFSRLLQALRDIDNRTQAQQP